MSKKETLCPLFILPLLIACTIGVVQREAIAPPTAVPPTATPHSNAAEASSELPTPRSTPTPMSASSGTSATTLPSAEATAFLSRSCPQINATTETEIAVEPCPGAYLDYGAPSPTIVLEEIAVETSVCERDYFGPSPTIRVVNAGDPCFLIRGRIKNAHSEGYYVGLWASGYNSTEYKVSWTLDAAHVVGMGLVFVDGQDVRGFTPELRSRYEVHRDSCGDL